MMPEFSCPQTQIKALAQAFLTVTRGHIPVVVWRRDTGDGTLLAQQRHNNIYYAPAILKIHVGTLAKAAASASAWLLEFNYILVALLCSSAFAAGIQVQTTCGAPSCAAL
eukprot:COSAG01_NODE_453_length_16866_cov_30.622175_15_plen_110_part_00